MLIAAAVTDSVREPDNGIINTEEDKDTVGDLLPNTQSTVVIRQSDANFVNQQFDSYNHISQTLSLVTSPLLETNPAFRDLFLHFIHHT
jgi:hypothetical protein